MPGTFPQPGLLWGHAQALTGVLPSLAGAPSPHSRVGSGLLLQG